MGLLLTVAFSEHVGEVGARGGRLRPCRYRPSGSGDQNRLGRLGAC